MDLSVIANADGREGYKINVLSSKVNSTFPNLGIVIEAGMEWTHIGLVTRDRFGNIQTDARGRNNAHESSI